MHTESVPYRSTIEREKSAALTFCSTCKLGLIMASHRTLVQATLDCRMDLSW